MRCEGEGSDFNRLDISGDLTQTSSRMEIALEGKVEGGGMLKMRLASSAERVGDCPD